MYLVTRTVGTGIVALTLAGLIVCAGLGNVFSAPSVKADPPFSANVRINDNINSTASQQHPFVAFAAGSYFVAWDDNRNGNRDIYFAKSTDGGATWTTPNVRVNSDTGTRDQTWPSIAADASGNVYLAWTDFRNLRDDIYFAKSTNGGATWTTPNVKVSDGSPVNGGSSSIAVDSQGNVLIAWEAETGIDADIYFAKSTDGGATWSAPNLRVNTDVGAADQWNPSLAVDRNGNIYVAWSVVPDHIYIGKSTDGGATWSNPDVMVDDDSDSQYRFDPSLAIDSSGNVYVAWQDYRSGPFSPQVYFGKSTDGGATWTAPNVRISGGAGIASRPSLAADPGGNLSIAWWDNHAGGWQIYLARSTDGGLTWTSPALKVNDDVGTASHLYPRVVVDSTGNASAVWQDNRTGNDDVYFARGNPSPGTSNSLPSAPFAWWIAIVVVTAIVVLVALAVFIGRRRR